MNIIREIKLFYLQLKFSWGYRSYFSTHKRVLKLAEKTLTSRPIIWNENDKFLLLCICILAMTITRMRSIHLLCRKGQGKDAVILIRVLFEDIVNFNYIESDKKRVKDFMDFDSYERLKLGKIVYPKWVKDITEHNIRISELESEWNKVKHRYIFNNKNGKEKVCNRWSCKTLEDMAKELKGEDNYNFLYRFLSTHVHLTSTAFNDYVLGIKKNDVVVEIGLSQKYIPETLITSSALVLDSLIKVVNKNYNLMFNDEIENLLLEIKNLYEHKKIIEKQKYE